MYENMMIFMYFQGKFPVNVAGHHGDPPTAFVHIISDTKTQANERVWPVRSLAGIFVWKNKKQEKYGVTKSTSSLKNQGKQAKYRWKYGKYRGNIGEIYGDFDKI